jgi:hypothetical protein
LQSPSQTVYLKCIKSRADALANLPNLGKVVPARGCGHFGNETGRTNCQASSDETDGGFFMPETEVMTEATVAKVGLIELKPEN